MSVILQGLSRAIAVGVIPGGAAGAHAVPDGMLPAGSKLLSVRQISDDAVTSTDRTAEFSVPSAGVISNVGGTDTTGYFLVFTYAGPASY